MWGGGGQDYVESGTVCGEGHTEGGTLWGGTMWREDYVENGTVWGRDYVEGGIAWGRSYVEEWFLQQHSSRLILVKYLNMVFPGSVLECFQQH